MWEDEDAEDDPLVDLGAVDRLKKLRKDKDQVTLSEYSALLQNRYTSTPYSPHINLVAFEDTSTM